MARLPLAEVHTPPYVYLDDSGTTPGHAREFLWAGYWGSFSFWESFGQAWNDILRAKPSVPFWHQTTARYRGGWHAKPGPLSSLSDKDSEEKELQLATLIGDNADRVHPIVVRLAHEDLERHVRGKLSGIPRLTARQRRVAEVVESPQFVSLLWTAKYVVDLQTADHPDNMPVSLVCEDRQGDAFKPHISRIWRAVQAHDSRVGSLTFAPGKSPETPQLQAADMLAWHFTRILKSPAHQEDLAWQRLGRNISGSYGIEAEHLKDHVRIWSFLPFMVG